MGFLGLLLVAIVLGLLPAGIAKSKGRDFMLWWLYGTAFFLVAVIHAIVLKDDPKLAEARRLEGGDKRCSYCAEVIKRDAVVCRFCGRDLVAHAPSALNQAQSQAQGSAT
jgi:hypothetical protein